MSLDFYSNFIESQSIGDAKTEGKSLTAVIFLVSFCAGVRDTSSKGTSRCKVITNQLVGGGESPHPGEEGRGNTFPSYLLVLHPSPAEYSGSLSKSWFLTLALKEIIWTVYKKIFKPEPLDPPILI